MSNLFPISFCTVIIAQRYIQASLNELQSIDSNLLSQEDDIVVEILLYVSTKFNTNQNFRLLSSSINFILKSERFSGSLL